MFDAYEAVLLRKTKRMLTKQFCFEKFKEVKP